MERVITAKLNNGEPNRFTTIWGVDCGFGPDYTATAECHYENGELVIDRIIQDKPKLGAVRDTQNQGL